MSWNHRVVKLNDEDGMLILAEVFYDENDKPTGYTDPFLCSETMGGLKLLVDRLNAALSKPVLDADDMTGGVK